MRFGMTFHRRLPKTQLKFRESNSPPPPPSPYSRAIWAAYKHPQAYTLQGGKEGEEAEALLFLWI